MSTNQIPQLMVEMATFAKVAEAGSFSEAARRLGSTPSAVSRAIARLERALGTRLIVRTTRKLRLSDEGEDVLRHAAELVAAARSVMSLAERRSAEPAGTLRISAPRALGRFLIHPNIPDFLAAHPSVDVVLKLDDGPLDPAADQVDIVFRITDDPPPGLVGRKLLRIEHVVCATPAYLARHGAPAHPRDLAAHSCVTLSEDPVDTRWRFEQQGTTVAVDVRGRYVANHSGVRLEAVLAGIGIGGVPHFVAAAALRDGRVERVLPDWVFKTNYYGDAWAFCSPSRHTAPKIRSFLAFIAQRIGAPG
ncbi:LysR substrate-binding domain-containing protein [Burkholderia sp. Ac-20379]|uniref:LysR substrate-binding domain-containing protein n=1 Tax=Burkholderia sp. Ac-20379 TaxID=2703900 RepID=UPI00197DF18B|nr:LysR family transcriptional regulator [Burkholderia sp. Ac-20379]